MLDRAVTGNEHFQTGELEWDALSKIERRLVALYRQLTEEDRKQLRRLTEALATVPEESAVA
ncbi:MULTISPECIES: hypothetical protein [Pseudomonas]|uniref:Transcriptional regulator n=1 Tax=Pseudomonas aphyarum TaxID=2942629 RepID=A0ABT5PNR0_9PSED|nr:hypothetical protein [Pseudomonas aphyarum]MDD0969356.1 hypothetical protein [Pseudomonas aphyarum]MDD1125545.1 hypothetical protein [Pseudomonas aphyarum]